MLTHVHVYQICVVPLWRKSASHLPVHQWDFTDSCTIYMEFSYYKEINTLSCCFHCEYFLNFACLLIVVFCLF